MSSTLDKLRTLVAQSLSKTSEWADAPHEERIQMVDDAINDWSNVQVLQMLEFVAVADMDDEEEELPEGLDD